MKVLVTGSAGFIGFHLVHRLVIDGHTVVGIDSINNYYDTNLKYGRLAELGLTSDAISPGKKAESSHHRNLHFYQIALEDNEALSTLFEKYSFDVVINLAAQPGVRYSFQNPHAYISSNITGFSNILECCRKFSIKHLIYASSSSVYGLNHDTIFSTDHSVDHPVSLYAATKRSNELMAHTYSHIYNLPTTGLRFFTVYGAWGRPDMAYFSFTKAILKEKPIQVFNNGNLMRDFTYIDDIVQGISLVMDEIPKGNRTAFDEAPKPSNSPAPFAIYNIGNNNPVKLLDFIGILENELGKKAVKQLLPMQPGDVYSTYSDITPLRELGYQPKTTLKAGLKVFVDWYKKFYNV